MPKRTEQHFQNSCSKRVWIKKFILQFISSTYSDTFSGLRKYTVHTACTLICQENSTLEQSKFFRMRVVCGKQNTDNHCHSESGRKMAIKSKEDSLGLDFWKLLLWMARFCWYGVIICGFCHNIWFYRE